jgi:hypothetical protein
MTVYLAFQIAVGADQEKGSCTRQLPKSNPERTTAMKGSIRIS